MNINPEVIAEYSNLLLESRITLPDMVDRLLDAGVNSYDVDLINKRIIFYDDYEEGIDLPFWIDDHPSVVGECFDVQAVAAAVKRNQRREIDYPTFIREIMKAGTSLYLVYLTTRRVVYHGVDNRSYEEPFPPPQEVF